MKVENPYLVTAFIFGIVLVAGRLFWRWGDMESAFLLLFFFLAAIGIRLDEITKKIGDTNERLDRLLDKCCNSISSGQSIPQSVSFKQSLSENSNRPVKDGETNPDESIL